MESELPNIKQTVFSDYGLLQKILVPYKVNCRYLKKAQVEINKKEFIGQGENVNGLLAKGEFSIPESCYIANTGHFNAVEFNICYNQLGYYLLATCAQNKLLGKLLDWNMEEYFQRQLSDMLIIEFTSSFHKLMRSELFNGYIKIENVFKKKKVLFIQTTCGFSDNDGGYSTGKVLLAIINVNSSSDGIKNESIIDY